MKAIVGDCAGLLKVVSVEKGEVLLRAGEVKKENEIQRLGWALPGSEEQIFVARKTGVIEQVSVADGSLVAEFKDYKGSVVNLWGTESHLVTGVDSGEVQFRALTPEASTQIYKTGKALSRVRANPMDATKFATGGKENDLKIWDVNNTEAIFTAKNVSNDKHNLNVPVFITDLHFLSEDSTKLVTSTEHHNVRIYDTKVGRKPQIHMSFGEYPFRSMAITADKNQVIVVDNIGYVRNIDLRMKREVAKYKGFTGAIKDVVCHETLPYLATVSLDRFLRVHHLTTKKLVKKVYLKQQLTSLLFSQEGIEKVEPNEDDEKKKTDEEGDEIGEESDGDDEGEDVWESIAEVKDDKKRKEDKQGKKHKEGKEESTKKPKAEKRNLEEGKPQESKEKKQKVSKKGN